MSVCRSCGWFDARKGIVIVSDRPEKQSLVDGVLHSSDGPAIRMRDGYEVWAWRGTRVPDWVIRDATIERIQGEENTEIRRCAIERYGWDRYLDDVGATPVSTEPDPGNPGHTLKLYDLPDAAQVYPERVRLVVMDNASRDRDGQRRRFAETVPADIQTAVGAQAWAFDVPEQTYRATARAT
jgi:hypothetical protein